VIFNSLDSSIEVLQLIYCPRSMIQNLTEPNNTIFKFVHNRSKATQSICYFYSWRYSYV